MNRRTDPLTYRHPRTTTEAFGCDATQAVAVYKYRTPLLKRVLFFICRHGWLTLAALIAAVYVGA
jgi:hypothetical protein